MNSVIIPIVAGLCVVLLMVFVLPLVWTLLKGVMPVIIMLFFAWAIGELAIMLWNWGKHRKRGLS